MHEYSLNGCISVHLLYKSEYCITGHCVRLSFLSDTTNLLELKQCMNNQMNDTGSGEPLVKRWSNKPIK